MVYNLNTQYHSMAIVTYTIKEMNTGQTPVVDVFDHRVFKLIKQVQ